MWGWAKLPIISPAVGLGCPAHDTFPLTGSGLCVRLKKAGISSRWMLRKAAICWDKCPDHMGTIGRRLLQ